MRKVREVLRLKYACGVSERVIARSVGIGRTAIGEYIRERPITDNPEDRHISPSYVERQNLTMRMHMRAGSRG